MSDESVGDRQMIESAGRHVSSRRLAFGAAASGAVNVFKVGIQLLLLPVMARLLGPEEFGVYALALPTVSFVALLADGGLGSTLAREPETSATVWSSAFWLLLVMGCTLALGASAFGVVLSYLVNQPRLASMIAILSLSIVFLALSVPAGARLMRRRSLGTGAMAELTASIIGAALAVVLAMNGAGAWSLVFQFLAIYSVRAIILNLAAFERPSLQFALSAIKPHMASGGLLVAARLVEYLGRVGENVLLERIFGTAVLGRFTFANQVSRFAAETAGNVVWATLYVQAVTTDRASIVDIHRRLCRLLAVVLFPFTMLAVAAAPELVAWLLGPEWTELAFILRVFLPVSALSIIAVQVGPVLLAIDRFEIHFWCSVALSIGRVLVMIAAFWTGLTGAVYGLALVTLLHFFALLFSAQATTGCRVWPILRGISGPTISSGLGAIVCLWMLQKFLPGPLWTIASMLIGLLAFLACQLVIDRHELREDLVIAKRILSRRGQTSAPPAQAEA